MKVRDSSHDPCNTVLTAMLLLGRFTAPIIDGEVASQVSDQWDGIYGLRLLNPLLLCACLAYSDI